MYDENQVYDNNLHSDVKVSRDFDDYRREKYNFQNNLN